MCYFYFFTFYSFVTLVFLNLFIAIILNGYFETKEQETQIVNGELLGVFRQAWCKFDPDATGFMAVG